MSKQTTAKVKIFLDRFASYAPGRTIVFSAEPGPCPTGFRLLSYTVLSSVRAYETKASLLLSGDGKTIFAGHAISLSEVPIDPKSSDGPETLSRYFTQKAGSTMRVTWDRRPGPGGAV